YLFYPSRSRHTESKRDWSSDVSSSDLGCRDVGLPLRALLVRTAPVVEKRASGPEKKRTQMDEPEHLVTDPVRGGCGHHAGVRMRDEDYRTRALVPDVLDKLLNVVFETHDGDVCAGFTRR